jgi:hypothetical protein
MSTGTIIIQNAFREIQFDSPNTAADSGDYVAAVPYLNSMIAKWLGQNMDLGCSTLSVAGDELNEPMDCTTGIIKSLAIILAPSSGGGVVTPELIQSQRIEFEYIKFYYGINFNKPLKKLSSTTPMGAGNTRGTRPRIFLGDGDREVSSTFTNRAKSCEDDCGDAN